MYTKNEVVTFRLDDSETPGFAKVELLQPTTKVILGYRLWKIKVVDVTRQSTLLKAKAGQVKTVSERWFSRES